MSSEDAEAIAKAVRGLAGLYGRLPQEGNAVNAWLSRHNECLFGIRKIGKRLSEPEMVAEYVAVMLREKVSRVEIIYNG